MLRLSNFQLYCLLLLFCTPIAFLQVGKFAINLLLHNAYLAVLATIVPGIFIIYMFSYIVQKSSSPFPFMLEEYFGKIAGKAIGFLYMVMFLFLTSFSLRLFIDFIETNVLPQTPISIFLGVLLLCGYFAIKAGLSNFARMCEVTVILGVSLAFIIVFLAFFQNADIKNLMPFAYMDFISFGRAVLMLSSEIFRLMVVLSLGFFIPDKKAVLNIMTKVLLTYILLITSITLAVVLVLGGYTASLFTFPTFAIVRIINIANFITNLDAIFIGLWVIGVFGSATLSWFMFCLSAQFVFKLKDYRFLAAPSSLIIAVFALQIASNILELNVIITHIVPFMLFVFFLLIPFIIFLITLFKPSPALKPHLPAIDQHDTQISQIN